MSRGHRRARTHGATAARFLTRAHGGCSNRCAAQVPAPRPTSTSSACCCSNSSPVTRFQRPRRVATRKRRPLRRDGLGRDIVGTRDRRANLAAARSRQRRRASPTIGAAGGPKPVDPCACTDSAGHRLRRFRAAQTRRPRRAAIVAAAPRRRRAAVALWRARIAQACGRSAPKRSTRRRHFRKHRLSASASCRLEATAKANWSTRPPRASTASCATSLAAAAQRAAVLGASYVVGLGDYAAAEAQLGAPAAAVLPARLATARRAAAARNRPRSRSIRATRSRRCATPPATTTRPWR